MTSNDQPNTRFRPTASEVLKNQFNPIYFIELAKRFRASKQHLQALKAAERVLQISPDNREAQALVLELEPLSRTDPNMVWDPPRAPVFDQPQSAPNVAQQPPQPFSNSGPIQDMALKKKRDQRQGSFGKTIFTLDARIEMSAENRALVTTYKLGNHIVYESANREKYSARARQHADNTSDQPSIFASPGAQAWGLARTLGRIGAAAFNAAASSLSLHITVNSLIEGVHIECKSMEEIVEAEEAITDAARNLKAYLQISTTFNGQEEIIDL